MKTITTFTYSASAVLALVCFAALSTAQAVTPPPDGGYPSGNTAEGQNALFSLTTGRFNTAVGLYSLSSDRIGDFNTAIGAHALYGNTSGNSNTAVGGWSLAANSSGYQNVATGQGALRYNTTGAANTATGFQALNQNTIGRSNVAVGIAALYANTTGGGNTAAGFSANYANTSGRGNTAIGYKALWNNTIGERNTAIGQWALQNNTIGTDNIGIGPYGLNGMSVFTADHVIAIGHPGADVSNTTWIGNVATSAVNGLAVYISSSGQLGLLSSSERFKQDIVAMNKTSEAILSLRPVTFRYKTDTKGTPQFGLIAEEVENVNPNLVVRDKEGKPYSVRYDQVNAMLLNEFLKEHKRIEEQQATIAELKKAIARLAASDEEQAAQIQKVSAQLEASKPALQVVNNP